MTSKEIINKLPYAYPFLFVDEITAVDDNSIEGHYTFDKNLPFYQGHFKERPITPGVILTETMAQIGLVAMGIYILRNDKLIDDAIQIAMTSSYVDFYLPVLPSEKVVIKSQKEYFRFNKLKCKVEMYNKDNGLVSRGEISGFIKVKK